MNTNEPCAAVFPVDEDFMRLPNNDVIQLEGRQQKITYYLTLGGWNISSPNHIINVIDKFDFSQLDVLVLVNSYHFLEHRVIEDIIRIAAQNNIEIYWAKYLHNHPLTATNIYSFLLPHIRQLYLSFHRLIPQSDPPHLILLFYV